jgi:hypothetical protein
MPRICQIPKKDGEVGGSTQSFLWGKTCLVSRCGQRHNSSSSNISSSSHFPCTRIRAINKRPISRDASPLHTRIYLEGLSRQAVPKISSARRVARDLTRVAEHSYQRFSVEARLFRGYQTDVV